VKAEVNRNAQRNKRHMRSRRKLVGTPERPRLNVYISLAHIYTQVIDDWDARTLVAAGTLEPEVAAQCPGGTANIEAAAVVGRVIGERARALGVGTVCFDSGGRQYHGRIKALAEAAREAGLDF